MTMHAEIFHVDRARHYDPTLTDDEWPKDREGAYRLTLGNHVRTCACAHGMHVVFRLVAREFDGVTVALDPYRQGMAGIFPCDGTCRAQPFLRRFLSNVRTAHRASDRPSGEFDIRRSWSEFSAEIRSAYGCDARPYGRLFSSNSQAAPGCESTDVWCFDKYHVAVISDPEEGFLSHDVCDRKSCRPVRVHLPASVARQVRKASAQAPR